MKKNILCALTCALFALAPTGALAGPFGLDKGMSLEQLKKQGIFVPTKVRFVYQARKLAKGHPDFEMYSALVSPQHGLCKITAIGNDVVTNVFGNQLEQKFKDITRAITRKYGSASNEFDFLQSGSIWKDPQDWMMGLVKKERVLASFWKASETTDLPDALSIIAVKANPLSSSKGYISLVYEFDNMDACIGTVESIEDANL